MQFSAVAWIRGDLLEAVKMAAGATLSGTIDGETFSQLPALNLADGRTIIIGKDFIGVLRSDRIPANASQPDQSLSPGG